MFRNLEETLSEHPIDYATADISLPFSKYIEHSTQLIADRRQDIKENPTLAEKIIAANSPFELIPADLSTNKPRVGALLIHGLLDCPFSLHEIGEELQKKGILSRALLLPGHGTDPKDLLTISYHDWIQAVRYGVESLRSEVDKIILVGYSTGATLSIYQTLHDNQIAGIILLSPAIKIRAPIDTVVGLGTLSNWLSYNNEWIIRCNEDDYTKYQSIAYNAAAQVSKLTITIREILRNRSLLTPIFMIISREDETISSHRAIDFFGSLHNNDSRMLLYTSHDTIYPDNRIETRLTHFPELNIKHLSHISMPFSKNNPHYGQQGDYRYASHVDKNNIIYGAYNPIEERLYNFLRLITLNKNRVQGLTYNPDFDFMCHKINEFISNHT